MSINLQLVGSDGAFGRGIDDCAQLAIVCTYLATRRDEFGSLQSRKWHKLLGMSKWFRKRGWCFFILCLLVGAVACSDGTSGTSVQQGPDANDAGADGAIQSDVLDDRGFDATAADAIDDVAGQLDVSVDATDDGVSADAVPDAAMDVVEDTAKDAAKDVLSDVAKDAVPDTAQPEPFQVFVATTGNDANDGLTREKSVKTLKRAHDIVASAKPNRKVEVRIAQGTYTGQSMTWKYYHPTYEIALMPVDYNGGGIDSIAGRPVFDGRHNGQVANNLVTLNAQDGRATNVSFLYLQIQGYLLHGIVLFGDRDDLSKGWNGGNRVYGCYFTEIGNLVNEGNYGYGAIDLVNSRGNEIRNNHFVDVANRPGWAANMHGVYLAHGSSENVIRSNKFKRISGDPIRVRDGSNSNQVIGNAFEETGSHGYISDWWCDKSQNPNCSKESGECPSWRNEFRDNELRCGYNGTTIEEFVYFQGEDYVPPWCVNHATKDGWKRINASNNVEACP